jgi:hypothetical protein
MVVDHPAVKIVAGVILGGVFGVLAFESVHTGSTGPQSGTPPTYTEAMAVVPEPPAAESMPASALVAPVSVAGGPLWLPAPVPPREEPVLLTERTTFPCASHKGASRVSVGWAVALFPKHSAPRSSVARAAAAMYATSLTWGGGGLSLAVSCSPGVPAAPAASVAQAAGPRPIVALDYPAESQPAGLAVSGVFKPVTDALP